MNLLGNAGSAWGAYNLYVLRLARDLKQLSEDARSALEGADLHASRTGAENADIIQGLKLQIDRAILTACAICNLAETTNSRRFTRRQQQWIDLEWEDLYNAMECIKKTSDNAARQAKQAERLERALVGFLPSFASMYTLSGWPEHASKLAAHAARPIYACRAA